MFPRILPLAVLLALAVAAPFARAEAPPTAPLTLTLDQGRFWYGGQIANGDVPDPSMCDVDAPCPTFELKVPAGGYRLRVAYDTPSREDSFDLQVIAPDGTVTTESGSNVFDAEAFVDKPAAGTWKVRVIPKGATDALVRLRAKVESTPEPKPAGSTPMLPNLKAVPPFEFGFVAPANPANAAYPPDTVNPPLSVAGQQPMECTVDEMAPITLGGGGAYSCLRFTSGPINAGDGPFLKEFKFVSDLANQRMHTDGPYIRGDSRQIIVDADGKEWTRPAGTYSFHMTHAHFHDDGILTYELFKVDGATLTPAGNGTKSGFCPADQLMGQWRQFRQDKSGDFGDGDTATGNCYGAADNGLLSLTRGWGDVYRWQRPGQYVDWGNNTDGLYVVRATVDKSNTTLETNEDDNAAYAFIRVTGRRVDELERGQGMSPFDPNKIVFTGYGPASQDPYGDLSTEAGAPSSAAAAADRSAPRTRVLASRGRLLRFRLSEPATVHVSFLRGSRVVRRLTIHARAGVNAVRLRSLRRGRYRVALVATDAAGNAAKAVLTHVRVR
jgi:hypothetical protein